MATKMLQNHKMIKQESVFSVFSGKSKFQCQVEAILTELLQTKMP